MIFHGHMGVYYRGCRRSYPSVKPYNFGPNNIPNGSYEFSGPCVETKVPLRVRFGIDI